MNLLRYSIVVFAFSFLTGLPADAAGKTLKLEELSFTDIDGLDRKKTIFFLTFGNLEEHGPHLPVGSDYFLSVSLRDGLINRLHRVHPDYDFAVVPVIPLGEGGANDAAGQHEHIGTFAVRFETLRNVAIDMGAAIARKGFQNVFLIHFHGTPLHNVAFTDAATFVSERYATRMVNISSLIFADETFSSKVQTKHLGPDWKEKIGLEIHAGAAETSANLFVRGDLVKPAYKHLSPFITKDMAEVLRTSERGGWEGYWGDPAKASKHMGKDLMADVIERGFQIAEKAIAGEDLSKLPVYPNTLLGSLPAEAETLLKRIMDNYAKQTAEIDEWLRIRYASKR